CTFGINHEAGHAAGLAAVQAIALSHRADSVWPLVMCLRPREGNQVALIVPELGELVIVAHNLLDEERSREFSKAFAHPLIVITLPTDQMTPPLVSNFVGSNVFEEVIGSNAHVACRHVSL